MTGLSTAWEMRVRIWPESGTGCSGVMLVIARPTYNSAASIGAAAWAGGDDRDDHGQDSHGSGKTHVSRLSSRRRAIR